MTLSGGLEVAGELFRWGLKLSAAEGTLIPFLSLPGSKGRKSFDLGRCRPSEVFRVYGASSPDKKLVETARLAVGHKYPLSRRDLFSTGDSLALFFLVDQKRDLPA